jgi:hypothetical protein
MKVTPKQHFLCYNPEDDADSLAALQIPDFDLALSQAMEEYQKS